MERPASVETARARPLVLPQTRNVNVDWPPVGELDGAAFARLTPRSRAAVVSSALPVLIPGSLLEGDPAELLVMARPKWTAVSGRGADGTTVTVHATRVVHGSTIGDASKLGPDAVRGHAAFTTQNEGIWSVSWREYGVTYALEVACRAPTEPRCQDARHLHALAANLRYVGGARHRAALEATR
ncbi:MAG: hypothetical protein AAF715_03300 [Myxococcota bacterium]